MAHTPPQVIYLFALLNIDFHHSYIFSDSINIEAFR